MTHQTPASSKGIATERLTVPLLRDRGRGGGLLSVLRLGFLVLYFESQRRGGKHGSGGDSKGLMEALLKCILQSAELMITSEQCTVSLSRLQRAGLSGESRGISDEFWGQRGAQENVGVKVCLG